MQWCNRRVLRDRPELTRRYLPTQADKSETSETRETSQDFQGSDVPDVSDEAPNVSDRDASVSANGRQKNPDKSTSVSDVSDVSLPAGDRREPVSGGAVCVQCGRPGGNYAAYGDDEIWLHRECQNAFIDRRMREEGVP